MRPPRRAVLYARVSRDDGAQDPQVQLDALRAHAAARGWTVVGEETDQISGDPARRKREPRGLSAALQRIGAREADVLVVFSAERLVRSTVMLLQLVTRVQSLGGHVCSLQDGGDLDTTSDMGELLVFMRGWMSRMELKLIRARTVAGLRAAKARGVVLGRPRVTVDVEAVRKLHEQQQSINAIAKATGSSAWAVRVALKQVRAA